MNILDGIRSKIQHGDFEFSRHATDRMILRHISIEEICEAIVTGEVIEKITLMTSTVRVA